MFLFNIYGIEVNNWRQSVDYKNYWEYLNDIKLF